MSNTRSVDDENVMAATEGLELTTAEEGATASGVLSIDSLQSFCVSATDLKKAKEAEIKVSLTHSLAVSLLRSY